MSRNSSFHLTFSRRLYPLEAALQACAVLTGRRADWRVEAGKGSQALLVHLTPKGRLSRRGREALEEEFWRELAHQALRLRIARETRKEREWIIEQALGAAVPRRTSGPDRVPVPSVEVAEEEVDKELEEILKTVEAEDFKEDPLQIAVPWEEKYGRKTKG